MIRATLRNAVLIGAAAGAFAIPAASAAAPRAHAAGACRVGNYYGYGYSYLTSIRVTDTSCATGRSVARHHGHVRGWRCSRRTLDRSAVQYDARVTCRSGRRTVVWTYTQNT